jgi:signal transduction histidine kinase/ligand-binding sensor domain-containing protein/DNA-binding response OmpR family regulator
MNTNFFFILLVNLLICSKFIIIKGQIHEYQNLRIEGLTVEDGLGSNNINVIYQDRFGFMWFGTTDGLCRFDGYEFKTYKKNPLDSLSLSGVEVNDIIEDYEGVMWLATNNGLNKFNRDKDNFTSYLHDPSDPASLSENNVTSILEDSRRNFWVTTSGGGLLLFNRHQGTFKQYARDDNKKYSLGSNIVYDIIEDKEHNLWLSTSKNGLYLMIRSEEKFIPFLSPDFPSSDKEFFFHKNLYEDSKGNIWISTRRFGLYIFNPSTKRFTHIGQSMGKLNSNIVYDFIQDNLGTLWIATDGGGINLYDPQKGSFSYIKKQEYDRYSLYSNAIRTFYIDNAQSLWIGTTKSGVNVIHKEQKKFFTLREQPLKKNTLSGSNILSIFEDKDKNIWIGTDGDGLNKYNPQTGKIKQFVHDPNNPESLPGKVIKCIYEDREKNMWLGTYADGLIQFDRNTDQFISYRNDTANNLSISSDYVWKIYEDSENNLWIGTLGGCLDKMNREKGTFRHFCYQTGESGSFPSENINDILEDSHNHLWIGTAGQGIAIKEAGSNYFRNIIANPDDPKCLSNKTVLCLHEDHNQNLWIGTRRGLNLLRDDSTFKKYFIRDGLPDNTIQGILEDNIGNLWISTLNGLSKFNPEKEIFKNYNKNDGLQGSDFVHRSCFRASDGKLYFGGKNGLNYFSPSDIKDNPYIPKVVLTELKLFNEAIRPYDTIHGNIVLKKSITDAKEIHLTYKDYVFSIKYAALNYISPKKNQYAYRLEGFEDEWNYVGNKREATYTNIAPGEYTFRVKASNNDGIWNEKGTAINILILPPFWQTKCAVFLYILLFIFISYLFRRYVIIRERFQNQLKIERLEANKAKEMNDMKLRLFTNISHELRTPLTLIINPLEKIIKTAKDFNYSRDSYQLKLMHRNSKRLLRLVNQLLDFRKLEAGELALNISRGEIVQFIKEIFESFKLQAIKKNIQYQLIDNVNYFHTEFDPDKIDKIIYNILSNAFKFTPDGGKIKLRLDIKEDEKFQIIISDTGLGIADKDLEHIFNRFYQATNDEKKMTEGTGIGLALVKEMVALHKGTIKILSKDIKNYPNNHGTSVIIELPLIKATKESEERDGISTKLVDDQTNSRDSNPIIKQDELIDHDDASVVLVIDDNQDIRSYLNHELSDEYRIFEACDGITGLDIAMKNIPDIIICDIMMPKLDGIELCKKLKSDEKTSHIPVILLTAKASNESKLEGLDSQADDYITKPFNIDILKARVKNLIQSREKLREKFSTYLNTSEEPKNKATTLDDIFIQKAKKIVEHHISDSEFDPEMFAVEIGMSRVQLYRKIKALTHKTVNEFLKTIRMQKAAELIIHSEMSVSEVAYSVGFKTPAHFSVTFSKHFGESPSKFAEKSGIK